MTKENIFASLKQAVLSTLPFLDETEVIVEASLRDFGANSIDRIDIILQTMESIGLSIPMTAFATVTNIRGIVDVLHERGHAV